MAVWTLLIPTSLTSAAVWDDLLSGSGARDQSCHRPQVTRVTRGITTIARRPSGDSPHAGAGEGSLSNYRVLFIPDCLSGDSTLAHATFSVPIKRQPDRGILLERAAEHCERQLCPYVGGSHATDLIRFLPEVQSPVGGRDRIERSAFVPGSGEGFVREHLAALCLEGAGRGSPLWG